MRCSKNEPGENCARNSNCSSNSQPSHTGALVELWKKQWQHRCTPLKIIEERKTSLGQTFLFEARVWALQWLPEVMLMTDPLSYNRLCPLFSSPSLVLQLLFNTIKVLFVLLISHLFKSAGSCRNTSVSLRDPGVYFVPDLNAGWSSAYQTREGVFMIYKNAVKLRKCSGWPCQPLCI